MIHAGATQKPAKDISEILKKLCKTNRAKGRESCTKAWVPAVPNRIEDCTLLVEDSLSVIATATPLSLMLSTTQCKSYTYALKFKPPHEVDGVHHKLYAKFHPWVYCLACKTASSVKLFSMNSYTAVLEHDIYHQW